MPAPVAPPRHPARRRAIRHLAAALLGIGAARRLLASEPAARPLSILVLGGTGFIGPHIVRPALARGHTLTLFNRGKTHPGMFPGVEELRGDRDGHLEALRGRRWDAVVDTAVYLPRLAGDSARLLKDTVRQYLLVSTISVYQPMRAPGTGETAVRVVLADPGTETVDDQSYGGLKALCEDAVLRELPDRATIIRPGLIAGPGDETDRFTYWVDRVGRGGEVAAPGSAADPVQFIDVRDLGEWIVRLLEARQTGTFNAVGPGSDCTIGELLETCRTVSGSDARFSWIEAKFLEQQSIAPWADMPLWLPPGSEDAGFARVSNRLARAHGLSHRPVTDTVRATLEWFRTLPAERRAKLKAGLSAEREAALLAAWHARR